MRARLSPGAAVAERFHDRPDTPRSTVAIGCLRNANAVARWLIPPVEAGRSIAIIAAGERWSCDDSLRPAVEDGLGAGAILSALASLGVATEFSPEASVAADAFDATVGQLEERIRACVSGQELTNKGFGDDVDVAIALNASQVVPVLIDGAFQSAGG